MENKPVSKLPINIGEFCEKCGKFVPGFEYKRCCDGHECGCMGLPIEPCLCAGCWAIYMS